MNSPNAIDETLCAEHWRMLFRHAIALGNSDETAKDAVQEVFLGLLRTGRYAQMQQEDGPLQGVLLRQKLKWVLMQRYKHARRLMRGGDSVHVSLDDAAEVAGGETPEVLHDRGLLALALKRAGVTEAVMFPDAKAQTSCERARLFRWKRKLRGRFEHFLS